MKPRIDSSRLQAESAGAAPFGLHSADGGAKSLVPMEDLGDTSPSTNREQEKQPPALCTEAEVEAWTPWISALSVALGNFSSDSSASLKNCRED